MKWEEIWEPGAVVVGVLLGLVILAKVVVALWQAHLPLAALGIAISSFLVNCVAVVILVLGFFFIIYAISALMSKTTEHARDTIREIKELKQNHSRDLGHIPRRGCRDYRVYSIKGLRLRGERPIGSVPSDGDRDSAHDDFCQQTHKNRWQIVIGPYLGVDGVMDGLPLPTVSVVREGQSVW